MNGMSRIEYELRAQLDTVKELQKRLEALMEICEANGMERSFPVGYGYETESTVLDDICALDEMLSDYIDAVKAAKARAIFS